MRDNITYRANRRNAWRYAPVHLPWWLANRRDPNDGYQVGTSTPSGHIDGAVSRSKYTPHIGNKERGRYRTGEK